MAEIINLRRFRKARDKAEKATRAADNRLLFGRPKADRTLAEKRGAIEVARLDGHKVEDRGTE